MNVNLRFKFLLATFFVVALGIAACAGNKQTLEQEESESFADLRAEVTNVVTDPERRQLALGAVDELEVTMRKLDKSLQERVDQFRQLYANYDTTQAEMEQATDDVLVQMKSNFDAAHVQFRQLSPQLTVDEWDAINKSTSKALNASIAALLDR